jgi:hypothetical protein
MTRELDTKAGYEEGNGINGDAYCRREEKQSNNPKQIRNNSQNKKKKRKPLQVVMRKQMCNMQERYLARTSSSLREQRNRCSKSMPKSKRR